MVGIKKNEIEVQRKSQEENSLKNYLSPGIHENIEIVKMAVEDIKADDPEKGKGLNIYYQNEIGSFKDLIFVPNTEKGEAFTLAKIRHILEIYLSDSEIVAITAENYLSYYQKLCDALKPRVKGKKLRLKLVVSENNESGKMYVAVPYFGQPLYLPFIGLMSKESSSQIKINKKEQDLIDQYNTKNAEPKEKKSKSIDLTSGADDFVSETETAETSEDNDW